jgi:hypothetical protein
LTFVPVYGRSSERLGLTAWNTPAVMQIVDEQGAFKLSRGSGVFMEELAARGFVLHYVIDNTHTDADLVGLLDGVSLVFEAAGLLVTGPQLMALELMERKDVTATLRYRAEGPWWPIR